MAREHHGEKYGYSLVPDVLYYNSKIDIICPIHGKFTQPARNHANGAGCRKCASPLKKTKEFTLSEFRKVHGEKYEYPDFVYLNNKQQIKIICPIHGEFKQVVYEHKSGSECPKCRKTYKKTNETFIEDAIKKHGDKYDYSLVNYINNSTPIVIICKEHGPFEQTPHAHMAGYGCSRCVSNSSKKENEWLDSLNIKILKKQARLKINDKIYIVDGYDPETNTVYQFHGDYFHGHPDYFKPYWKNRLTKKTFGELFEKTNKIKELFISNGYKYVEQWEHDYNSKISSPFKREKINKEEPDCRFGKEYINAQKIALGEDFDMSDYLEILADTEKII